MGYGVGGLKLLDKNLITVIGSKKTGNSIGMLKFEMQTRFC